MKKAFLLFIACMLSVTAFAKGGHGFYTMEGVMFDKVTKKPEANIKFVINGDTVVTDSNGKYTYQVEWSSACPSGEGRTKIHKLNKKLNPPIAIIYHNKVKKVKNKWRECFNNEKTFKVDLYF